MKIEYEYDIWYVDVASTCWMVFVQVGSLQHILFEFTGFIVEVEAEV
jgi:hypothetical protein